MTAGDHQDRNNIQEMPAATAESGAQLKDEPRAVRPDAIECLRQLNTDLRNALVHLRPERKRSSTVTAQDLLVWRNLIGRASELLRNPATAKQAGSAFERESAEFRSTLEQLRRYLPTFQVNLVAEKKRLQTSKTHLGAARDWAKANTETL